MARPKKTVQPPVNKIEDAAPANEVDVTVVNQENPVSSDEQRESTDTESSPEVAKMAPANEVDETVVNQENPGTSEKERESTDTSVVVEPEYAKMAPALPVDETVENQMNPGINMVDRSEPVIVADSAGVEYDLSKPYPELVTEEKVTKEMNPGVMDASAWREEDEDAPKKIEIVFVEGGFTALGRVWKKGQTLSLDDTEEGLKGTEDIEGNSWTDLSASEQEERYGRVMFEKR